jgi:hypothetical protein
MGRREKLEAVWTELNEHLDVKVQLNMDPIHYGLLTTGKIFLTRDRLITVWQDKVRYHWWEDNKIVSKPSFVIPLERIEKVFSTNDKKWEPYRKMSEKLKARGKALVGMVLFKDKDKKERMFFFFAPKAEISQAEAINRVMAAAAGYPSFSSTGDLQVRTANKWAQMIKEAVQSRKIAILEERGLTQAWKCEYCETLNDVEKERCSHCGSPRRETATAQKRYCRHCGFENKVDSSYCEECGKSIDEQRKPETDINIHNPRKVSQEDDPTEFSLTDEEKDALRDGTYMNVRKKRIERT